ncbi:hypothetical protein [Campylobacter sp. RM15925]|uniref:hypothetical protein n=1 Tax=Campylobacter sp. RM15925 TaxID=1705724 RepID=UPI001472E99A|nr:hypothetical protein [Campylobacter sp. RM15925]
MTSFDFLNHLEPIVTVSALLLTGLNWIISLRIDSINKRLDSLENLVKIITKQTEIRFKYDTRKTSRKF